MRKVLIISVAVLVAAVVVLVLSLTILSPGNGHPEHEHSYTKTYAALSILNEETYTFAVNASGIRLTKHRNGDDNIALDVLGIPMLIRDGNRINFDFSTLKGHSAPATAEDIEEFESMVLEFGDLVNLDTAEFIGTGTAQFMMTFEYLFYEKFREEDGIIKRVFFNDDDELVGIRSENDAGDTLEVGYSISSEVPGDAFDIPEGFELTYEPRPPRM